MKPRMDLMSRKILCHIAHDAGYDVASVARAVGCTTEVAEDRIRRLQADGVVRGFRAAVDPSAMGSTHEALVVGVPSHETDPGALQRLAAEADVARVFTMAAQASIGFHLYGTDPDVLEARAAQLAKAAGLQAHRCTLLVSSWEGAAQAALVAV